MARATAETADGLATSALVQIGFHAQELRLSASTSLATGIRSSPDDLGDLGLADDRLRFSVPCHLFALDDAGLQLVPLQLELEGLIFVRRPSSWNVLQLVVELVQLGAVLPDLPPERCRLR